MNMQFTSGRAVCMGPAVCGGRRIPLVSSGSANRYKSMGVITMFYCLWIGE